MTPTSGSDDSPAATAGRKNDAHTHVGMNGSAAAGSEADALILAMDDAGVERAAVITPSTVNGDNGATFDAVRRYPSRFVGVALVDMAKPDPVADAASAIDAGASGIRFNLVSERNPHRFANPDLDSFWSQLIDRSTVAVFHAHPEQLAIVGQIAGRHPGLSILVDHLGRPNVSSGVGSVGFRSLLRLAASGNVSVKTPNVSFFSATRAPHLDLLPFLDAALRAFGPWRVLWGSDWPVCVEGEPYGEAALPTDRALASYTAVERDAVFAGNFDTIFGLQA